MIYDSEMIDNQQGLVRVSCINKTCDNSFYIQREGTTNQTQYSVKCIKCGSIWKVKEKHGSTGF